MTIARPFAALCLLLAVEAAVAVDDSDSDSALDAAINWAAINYRVSPPPPVSYDVGVIPGGAECANGVAPIEIVMDDENDGGDALWGCNGSCCSGWTGGIFTNALKNTHFRFCRVDGQRLKPLTTIPDQVQEYAVLKLGDRCPVGSTEFGRFFHSEDYWGISIQYNWHSGDIHPNWQRLICPAGGPECGTMLRFCLFRYGPDTLVDPSTGVHGWPDFGFSYGVFAAHDFPAAAHGSVHVDDQNRGNASYFEIPSSLDVSSVYRIIEGSPHNQWTDTDLATALVKYR